MIRIFGEIRARKPSVYKGFENGNNEILHKFNKNEEKGNLFMEQKKFTDVVRLGHKSTAEVLNVGDNIIIQEKLDGANASFSLENGELYSFSRRLLLDARNTLGGFYEFVLLNFESKKELLSEDYIYFGEWLNPHKVKYEGYQKQFFLFDIWSKSERKYLDFDVVELEAVKLGLNLIPVFYKGTYESYQQLEQFIGKTLLNGKLGDKEMGEGIVVKNVDFRDRFGNQMFVKLVVDDFREVQKQKKPKDPTLYKSAPEFLLAESIVTKARVEKIIFKLRDEGLIDNEIEQKDVGIIFKECNIRTYEDIIKEESDSITPELDIEVLRKHISSLAKKFAREYLMEIGVF